MEVGTPQFDVQAALAREGRRREALLEEADRLLQRRRKVLAEISRIEQLLGLKPAIKRRTEATDPMWSLAYTVLAQAGRPMHIKEIVRLVNLQRSQLRELPVERNNLTVAIRAKPATFVLLYSYTWGLREWATQTNHEHTTDQAS